MPPNFEISPDFNTNLAIRDKFSTSEYLKIGDMLLIVEFVLPAKVRYQSTNFLLTFSIVTFAGCNYF